KITNLHPEALCQVISFVGVGVTANDAPRDIVSVAFFLPRYQRDQNDKSERRVARGTFSEAELRQLLAAASHAERAMVGVLSLCVVRSGELYALDWESVDLDAGALRIVRSWDHLGGKFVQPKTASGHRCIPLSSWLVAELKGHRERGTGQGL